MYYIMYYKFLTTMHGSVEFSSDRGVAFVTFFSRRLAKKETFDSACGLRWRKGWCLLVAHYLK